jgi:hypothetical protein
MKRFGRLIVLTIGMAIVGLVVTLVPHTDTNAQSPTQVQVVNTPLPVSGVVAVRGGVTVNNTPLPVTVRGIAVGAPLPVTGAVSVGNFPSTQPVSFNNSAKAPLFVQDVDSGGRNPFAVSTGCSTATSACPANVILPSNTANHGLVQTVVIEFVTVLCSGMTSGITQFNFNFNYTLNGQQQAAFFPAAVDPFGVGRMAQLTALYADPGQTATFGPPGPASGCFVTLSGHLIPR